MNSLRDMRRSNLKSINCWLLILYTVFAFSSGAIVSERFSVYYFAAALLLIGALSVLFCPVVLQWVSGVSIPARTPRRVKTKRSSVLLKFAFYGAPLLYFLIYYFAFYPGGFTKDSFFQYEQTISNSYSDWHPTVHTLLVFKLPLTITGGWIGSVILFQVICFSVVLGKLLQTIHKHTNTQYTFLSALFIFLNPQLGHLAMYPWKDTAFTIGVLLSLTYAMEIFLSKGAWMKKPLHMILFIIVVSLTTLFRHNALLFTIPLLIAVFLTVTKKRGVVILAGVLVLCAGIKYPLYAALHVEKPDQRQVEMSGLPMTVIGAVAAYAPETMDEEAKEFVYKVAPKETWESKYQFGSYNSVKFDQSTDNTVIEKYGIKKVAAIMLRCINGAKYVALYSLIKLTDPVYTITDPYYHVIECGVVENDYQIQAGGSGKMRAVLDGFSNYVADSFPHLSMYLGVMHLLLITAILSKCKFNKPEDWKKIMFICPVFAYNFGTMLLMTSYWDSVRFFSYLFPAMPLLLVFLFHKSEERMEDDTVR